MEKKKIYYINEQQASVLIKEELSNPDLMQLVGEKHAAFPHPVSTGKFDDKGSSSVGVSPKDEKPAVDLKSLPKPVEIKQAWRMLQKASDLLLSGAPKLQNEELAKEIKKMSTKINDIVMEINGKINVNEIDLTT